MKIREVTPVTPATPGSSDDASVSAVTHGPTIVMAWPAEASNQDAAECAGSGADASKLLGRHSRWVVTGPNRGAFEVRVVPPATASEMQEVYPAAACTPLQEQERVAQPSLSDAETATLNRWLDAIGETDPAIRSHLLNQCRDPEALAGFLAQANNAPPPVDDRRDCASCTRLSRDGTCQAAARGELARTGRRKYSPATDLPRRCEGYRPSPDDPDRRPGTERWPNLLETGK